MRLRKSGWKTLTLLIVLMMLTGLCAARAEVITGIDLIILLDCSKSMSHDNYGATDKNYDRCDAAVMMINMCDAKESSVAVVPFTDEVKYPGTMFNQMLDMSNLNLRSALCNNILDQDTLDAKSGLTKCGEALKTAYALLSQRRRQGSQNQSVVLLLSDGDISDQNESRLVADDLKRQLGASIYCVYLNPEKGSNNEFLKEIAGTAKSHSSEKYYRHGQSSDMVAFFSDIFADLIGSQKETREVQIQGDTCVIPVDIPNGSIFETNLAFRTSLIDQTSRVLIYPPDSDRPITDSNMVHSYEYNRGKTRGYDYYSVKLMDHPEPGEWRLTFKHAAGINAGTRVSYDVLYNYEIQLAGELNKALVNYSDTLSVDAYFITPDGTRSADSSLYRFLENGLPAIPAVLSVEQDGRVIYRHQMENDRENLCYHTEIDMRTVRGHWRYGDYTVRVHAEGDTLYRDLIEDLTFTLRNNAPEAVLQKSMPEITCLVDNVFGDDSDGGSMDVWKMFEDVDGDQLTYDYSYDDPNNILEVVQIDDGVLSVRPRSGKRGEAWISVMATDSVGASAMQRILVRVESVMLLIQEGQVTAQLCADPENALVCKGGNIRVNLVYELDSTINGLFTVDDVQRTAQVSFTVNGKPVEVQTDLDTGTKFCEYTFGPQEGDYQFEAEVELAGCDIKTGGFSESVANHSPTVRETVEKQNAERDIDIDQESTLEYDLSQVFEDQDMAVQGYEHLTYSCTNVVVMNQGKRWLRPAQVVLRLVGLKPKNGNEIEVLESENEVKRFRIKDTGVFRFSFDVIDNDGATASYDTQVTATSRREIVMCMVVYGIGLLILIALIAVAINRFVIHQPWPHRDRPGSSMTAYRDTIVQSVNNRNTWDVDIDKRKHVYMNRFYQRFGDRDDPDYRAICKELEKIKVWPTTGECFVVELKDKTINATITVNGKDLKKVKKAKWPNGTQMRVVLRLTNGNVIDLLWKRAKFSGR